MTTIEKIKAEIERLMDEYKPIVGGVDELTGAHIVLANLLSFLDTLEEEKPMNQEGLEEEIKRYGKEEMPVVLESDLNDIARHFAEWGKEHAKIDVTDFCKPIDPGIAQCIADHSWEMLGEDEKPVPNDLEEAAEKSSTQYYQDAGYSPFPNVETAAHKSGFIAGSEWQKEQDDKELSDLLTIAHLQGAEQMKEQMMKEAREADVNTYRDLAAGKSWAEFVVEKPPKNLGDKVRIIIVKEDEK